MIRGGARGAGRSVAAAPVRAAPRAPGRLTVVPRAVGPFAPAVQARRPLRVVGRVGGGAGRVHRIEAGIEGGDEIGHELRLLGRAVDLRDGVAVIASPFKAAGSSSGTIHVYLEDEQGEWLPSQELSAPPGDAIGGFGRYLALGDDFLVTTGLGYGQPGSGTAVQSLYVFDRSGDQFTFAGEIDLNPLGTNAAPVRSLAADGDTIVVGFPFAPSGKGFGRIYQRVEGEWILEETYVAPGLPPAVAPAEGTPA